MGEHRKRRLNMRRLSFLHSRQRRSICSRKPLLQLQGNPRQVDVYRSGCYHLCRRW